MPSEQSSRLLKQAAMALDTAKGICDLVAEDIKPSDLPACRAEITAALQAIDDALYREVHG